ncbi:hypothetical protein SME22J_09060 [Serratia marcescens]|nr:hypothetical protein SME22J_09060 [Serratia marcescens]
MPWPTAAFKPSPAHGPWLCATLLLLAACGHRLWAMWPQPMPPIRPPASVAPPVATPLDIAALAQVTLFQPPPPGGPAAFRVGTLDPSSPQLRAAPLSALNARLTGVISGPRGLAVVEIANRQSSYGLGDTLAGEAEVVRLFSDRIIISRRGQYEALPLN